MTQFEINQRPIRITLLTWLTLAFAIWNGLRLVQVVFFWSVLKEYLAAWGPLYIAISGGFWLFAALFIFIGLWQRKIWSWSGIIGLAFGYSAWYWFDRLVLEEPHANWPFALACTILLVGILAFIIFSPKTCSYFKINIGNKQ
jgi:hypothetical protein